MSPSGRSPYPTRSRRRQQLLLQQQQQAQQNDTSVMDESSSSAVAAAAASPRIGTTTSPFMINTSSTVGGGAAAGGGPGGSAGGPGSSTTGNYMMGQSLVQARLSPANAASASTSTGNRSGTSRKFFDWNAMTPSGGGNSGTTPTAPASSKMNFTSTATTDHHQSNNSNIPESAKPVSSNNNNNTKEKIVAQQQPPPDVHMDGLNLTHLRQLTQSCLGTKTTSSTNAMAVFYASIVYAKTPNAKDAFVYAQCLLRNNEPKRCVRLLETTKFNSGKSKIEATLLATEALASLGEWQTVLALLEDPLQYSMFNPSTGGPTAYGRNANNVSTTSSLLGVSAPPLEDDDDIGWQALAQSIPIHDDEDDSENNAGNSNYALTRGSTMIHPLSRICCWRGQAYAETGHPLRAATYWKRALTIDPLCVQALDYLLDRSVCPSDQALEVILHLNFPSDMDWLRALYLARVHVAAPKSSVTGGAPTSATTEGGVGVDTTNDDLMKQHKMTTDDPFWQEASSIQLSSPIPTNPELSSDKIFFGEKTTANAASKESSTSALVESSLDTLWNTHKLNNSSEVLAMAAKRAYRRHDLRNALQYCQELATVDPLCQTAGFVYVSTLVALKHKRELFRLAHEWVDAAPKSAKAWFAVGAYYYTCERYHVAQRHFCRATRLDPHCSEAWIAFGTSFAACDESDQALASFRAAQRLAPGDHTSLLYIGMEYLRTNHLTLAQHFLQAAHRSSSGSDPLCKNELGVLCMSQKNYPAAIRWFLKALVPTAIENGEASSSSIAIDDIPNSTMLDVYWEPTLFNLGQAYRKTRQFVEAGKCFERCLTIQESASAYAALAFCKHLQGEYDEAIDTYHQSLSRKPDDPFCSEMLHRCLQDALDQTNLLSSIGGGDIPQGEGASISLTTGLAPPKQQQNRQSMSSSAPTNHHNPNNSLWTDDGEGLSISVDTTSSDVDMG